MGFAIERQHSAALAAVIAMPYIRIQIQLQLAALISADRAIGVGEAWPPPPDVQTEKGGHVHDGKGKSL